MRFLFGFSGRIGREKMRLFLLVSMAWLFVVGLALIIGLGILLGQECIEDCAGKNLAPGREMGSSVAMIAGLGLLAAYLLSCLSVFTKRLHDRDKSAYWLVPYVLIPFVLIKLAAPFALRSPIDLLGLAAGVVCFVGAVLATWGLVELFFFSGTVGPNDYGPDPQD